MTDPHTAHPKTPWHLWAVGIIGLLWNAFGAYDYVMTQTRNEAHMERFTEVQLDYFYSVPAWADATWALAVWGGVLGCILLLLRTRWAVPVFIVSLVSMAINMVYMYGVNNGIEVMGGPGVMIFSSVIAMIASLLLVYAMRMRRRGVLR